MTIERMGIFADFALPKAGAEEAWVQRLVDLGVTDVILSPDHSDDAKLQFRMDENHLLGVTDLLWERDIANHLMFWLTPNQEDTKNTVDVSLRVAEAAASRSILFDAEYGWISGPRDMTHDAAADLVLNLFADTGAEIGVTSYGYLPNALIPLCEVCDYTLPQCYSIWSDLPKDVWTKGAGAAPGVLQKAGHRTYLPHSKHMKMALACYYQTRPGMTQTQAMDLAWDTSAELEGIDEIWYWSLAWLFTGGGHEQRREWISAKGKELEYVCI